MNEAGSDRIVRYRKEIRGGLIALALPTLIVGAWALFAPKGFYDEFPGGGREWISALGPYDEHLVRDFGSLYLGLGLLMAFAAYSLVRVLVQAALGTYLVFSVPHFIYHASDTGPLSTSDNVINLIVLALGLGLAVILLVASFRAERRTIPEPGATGARPIEEGVTYGTR